MKKLIAGLLMATVVFSGCSGSSGDAGAAGKVQEIKDAGKITMYTNAEFPPYEFMENNEIVGVDVEIGKKIAAELGVELEVVNAEFGGIVAAIASGKGDMAITGMTITDERKESVNFSTPYVDSVQYLILPEGSDIKVMEDLAGKSLGCQEGTTGAMLVEDEIADGALKDKDVTLNQYKSAPIAMQDLVNGRIAAVVIDEMVAKSIAKGSAGYEAIPFVYASGAPVTEQFGVAVNKDNTDLLEVIDTVVQKMVDDGEVSKLIDQFSGE